MLLTLVMTISLQGCENTRSNPCLWGDEVLPVTVKPETKYLTSKFLADLHSRKQSALDDLYIAASNNRDVLTINTTRNIKAANDAFKNNCKTSPVQ